MPDPQAPPLEPATPAPSAPTTDFFDWTELPQATPPAPQEFLRVNDRTVYLTPEAARAAFQEAQRTITAQQQHIASLQQAYAKGTPANSLDALDASIRTSNPDIWQNALRTEIRQEMQREFQSAFAPLMPTIGYANFSRAVEIASLDPRGDPNIANWVRTPSFREMAKEWPTLATGIEQARYNPIHAERELPEMLILGFREAQRRAGAPPASPQKGGPTIPSSTAPPQTVGAHPGGADVKDIPWSQISPTDWATANATQGR